MRLISPVLFSAHVFDLGVYKRECDICAIEVMYLIFIMPR